VSGSEPLWMSIPIRRLVLADGTKIPYDFLGSLPLAHRHPTSDTTDGKSGARYEEY